MGNIEFIAKIGFVPQTLHGFYLDAPQGKLADETAKLRYDAPDEIGESARVIAAYESSIMGSTSLEVVVLCYGFFYGPGT